jgi:hypothetical protein
VFCIKYTVVLNTERSFLQAWHKKKREMVTQEKRKKSKTKNKIKVGRVEYIAVAKWMH